MSGAAPPMTLSAGVETILAGLPDVLIRLDRDLRLMSISPNVERLTGLSPPVLVGKTARELGIAPVVCDGIEVAARRALVDEAPTEARFTEGGRTLRIRFVPERGAGGRVASILGIVEEVSESRRAEDALRANDAGLRALIEPWVQAYWTSSGDGYVVEDSPSWRAYTGQLREEWLGEGWVNAIHPDDRAYAAEIWHAAISERRPLSAEFRLRRAGGGWRWTNVRASPVLGPDGRIEKWVGMNIDISDRKRDEQALRDSREQLRRLAAKLLSVREEEKARIARDLHDELGQLLTALKLQVRSVESGIGGLPEGEAVNAVLDRAVAASELADEAVASVQRIALELRPGALDRLGLGPALLDEARRFAARSGIRCEAVIPERLTEVAPEAATALYRIGQEAMTNVLRHAHATRLTIRLEVILESAILRIEDDGRGLEAKTLEAPTSLGLLGMVERARTLGGEVTFERRSEDGGTVVVARVPLRGGAGRG